MRKLLCVVGTLSVACVLIACSTATPREAPPPVAAQAGLGIVVEIHPMMGAAYSAESVYFARVDESGQLSLSTLYGSNFRRGDRVYLLNVPPGRYAAVAAVFRVGFIGPASTYITYFPGSVIERTALEAVQRQVSYAGRYVLGTGIGVCGDKADPLQARVAEAISPGAAKCGLAGMLLHELASKPVVIIGGSAFTLGPSTFHYRGIELGSSNDEGERRAFLNSAQKELSPAGWVAAVP
jgi:hypothetical protein